MTRRRAPARRRGRRPARARTPLPGVRVRELAAAESALERRVAAAAARWNADPEDVQRSVARLVLTLVDFLRALFEKQALRRVEAGTLSADEIERLGLALMRLEKTVRQLARRFGLSPADLNLDLGPLGRLR